MHSFHISLVHECDTASLWEYLCLTAIEQCRQDKGPRSMVHWNNGDRFTLLVWLAGLSQQLASFLCFSTLTAISGIQFIFRYRDSLTKYWFHLSEVSQGPRLLYRHPSYRVSNQSLILGNSSFSTIARVVFLGLKMF